MLSQDASSHDPKDDYASATSRSSEAAHGRVLVVDDEPGARSALSERLREEG